MYYLRLTTFYFLNQINIKTLVFPEKATQDSKETHPHDLLDLIDIQHGKLLFQP